MKKRLLSLIVALCLCLTLFPTATANSTFSVTKNADGTYSPTSGGKLAENLTLDNKLVIQTNTELDLNGYTLGQIAGTQVCVIEIKSGATLTLKDSKGDGQITCGKTSQLDITVSYNDVKNDLTQQVGGVYINSGGKLVMEGGKLSSCIGLAVGGIYIDSGGSMEMSGGTLSLCQTSSSFIGALTGGVYVASNASFTMTGGMIWNCFSAYSLLTGTLGACVVSHGTFTISGSANILYGFHYGVDTDSQPQQTYAVSGNGTLYLNGGNIDRLRNNGTIQGSGNNSFSFEYIENFGKIQSGVFSSSSGEINNNTRYNSSENRSGIVSGGDFHDVKTLSQIYTVTFDTAGGSTAPGTQWRCRAPATEPDAPTKKNCVFLGWYNGDTLWDFTQEISSDITLTARWHEHSWASDWQQNDTHHWHSCTADNCPLTDNSQKDSYSAHNYSQELATDTYFENAASCDSPATYYKSCICGAKGTQTFSVGSALPHQYTYTAANNVITETCTRTGCNHSETTTITAPTGDLTYNGTTFPATVTYSDGWSGGDLTICYMKNGLSVNDTTSAGNYTASITKDSATATVTYAVAKATPTITAPTATVIYGDTVSHSDLKNGTASADGSFQWMPSVTSYGDATDGTPKTLKAQFIPKDTTNYNPVENIEVSVTINKATLKDVSVTQTTPLTYDSTAQTAAVNPKATTVDGCETTFTYSTTEDGTYNTAVPAFFSGTNKVYYRVTAANHEIASGSFDVIINKAPLTIQALNKRAYVGRDAPDLRSPVEGTDYTITGLIGTDTLADATTIKLSCTPDMTKTGKYDIVPSIDGEDPRYDFNFVNGVLTISHRPSSTYPVTTPSETESGTVSVDKKAPAAGETVTITPEPAEGYEIDQITVTDKNGNAIEVKANKDGSFSFVQPNGNVTIEASFLEKAPQQKPFDDVSTDSYFHDAVQWALEQNITTGVEQTLFGPDRPCTRAQLVTFLWRAVGQPAAHDATGFTDVDENGYYIEAVRWAAGEKIIEGYGNQLFGPDDTITREQVVTILHRFAVSRGMDVSVGEDTNILSYQDALTVSEYAIAAFQWACGSSIVQGYDGCLTPQAPCSRAQIVTMLYRLLDK